LIVVRIRYLMCGFAMCLKFHVTRKLAYEDVIHLIFFINVKSGGTAAQDSQSEANEGAYPPLPPTPSAL